MAKQVGLIRTGTVPEFGIAGVKVAFPVIRETEKAILIRTPKIIGSGYDAWADGTKKEVWVPKSQLKEVGDAYELKEFIWDKIAPSTVIMAGGYILATNGHDLKKDALPSTMLGNLCKVIKSVYKI